MRVHRSAMQRRLASRRRVQSLLLVLLLVGVQLALGSTASANETPVSSPSPLIGQVPTSGYGEEAPEAADEPTGTPTPSAPVSPSVTNSVPSSSSSSSTPSRTPTPTPTSDAPASAASGIDPTAIKKPLTVAIDFDDGTADQFQLGAILKAHNMAGVFFINSARIGLTSTYMNLDQLRQLAAAGNEIGGHTVFHLHLPQQSVAEQLRQICTDRDQLLALGFKVTDMAFPFGDFTPASQAAVRQCGYNSVRTSEGGDAGGDTIPPADPYSLKALSSLGPTTTTKQVEDAVENAEKNGGGLLQLVFHKVCAENPCRTIAIHLDVFNQIVDWLAAQRAAGLVQVKTVAQVIGESIKPPVAAPAPTATLAVPNSSFEGGISAADVPTCWEHTLSSDDNVATWSLVHDSHSGSWAEHLVASSVVGGVALVVAQDEGSCAAPATVGDRYTYGLWYKSTAPVHLVAYRRLSAGGYLTYGLSDPFPASPDKWTYAEVTTKPMPADTGAISIGVAIKDAGQFTFDDFSIRDAGPAPAITPAAAAVAPAPSTSAMIIPFVQAATNTPLTRNSWWSDKAPFAAILLLVVVSLALVDRRLAHLRRSSTGLPKARRQKGRHSKRGDPRG